MKALLEVNFSRIGPSLSCCQLQLFGKDLYLILNGSASVAVSFSCLADNAAGNGRRLSSVQLTSWLTPRPCNDKTVIADK